MRKWIVSALTGLALVITLAAVGWQNAAQNTPAKGGKDASLPIRQVMLFNSGVSYFEREGEVTGDVRIDLSFPTNDINDLLKSLVLQDMSGVGKISTVNYDSHDPLEKVLHSFALDLNGNPSYAQILNQARGEKIEITRLDMKLLADMLNNKAYNTEELKALRAFVDDHLGRRLEVPTAEDSERFNQSLALYLIVRDLLKDLNSLGGGFMSQLE